MSGEQRKKWADVANLLAEGMCTSPRSADTVSQHWLRVLNPEIERARWTVEEDDLLR